MVLIIDGFYSIILFEILRTIPCKPRLSKEQLYLHMHDLVKEELYFHLTVNILIKIIFHLTKTVPLATGFFGQEKGYTTETPPTVMLKFTSGPSSRQDSCPGAEEGFLSVKAHDFGLHFKTSSLTTLTNFIEDDNAGESTPMHVDVSNFMLILQVRQL